MKILGYTDSKHECTCGKQNLKGVFIVQTNNGELLELGSSCVKKNWDLNQAEFKTLVKAGYNEALAKANLELENSWQFKLKELENNHEYGTEDFDYIRNENKEINKIKLERLEKIRKKYLLEKKHFNANRRIAFLK